MSGVVFLFPGQGAFYSFALQQARSAFLPVERILSIGERVALQRAGCSLVDATSRPGGIADLVVSQPMLSQLAIFISSVAAAETLTELGIRPNVLVGHSFGEIAALTCAGVFSVETGCHIVCDRVEALAEAAPADGCMAAVLASPANTAAALGEWGADRQHGVAVAVENHDGQTVVSGTQAEIVEFVAYCATRKISAQRLHSPYGFHHPSLAAARQAFATRLARYDRGALQRPVYSPILGRYYGPDDDLGASLAEHLVLPVRFSTALRQMEKDGASMFVECGALDALSKIARRVFGPGGASTLPVFSGPGQEVAGIRRIVSALKEIDPMSTTGMQNTLQTFEEFWRERAPVMLSNIRAEFERFIAQDRAVPMTPIHAVPTPVAAMASAPAVAAAPVAVPPVAAAPKPSIGGGTSRGQIFSELADLYAEAMEYPREVFNEAVELEAELGIDSVKQTEIMGRISNLYSLPPIPANVRVSDYKTMGQIVDFVFENQNKAA